MYKYVQVFLQQQKRKEKILTVTFPFLLSLKPSTILSIAKIHILNQSKKEHLLVCHSDFMAAENTISPNQDQSSAVALYQVPEVVVDAEKLLYHTLYGQEAYVQLRKFSRKNISHI
jgi:hypothetical protein